MAVFVVRRFIRFDGVQWWCGSWIVLGCIDAVHRWLAVDLHWLHERQSARACVLANVAAHYEWETKYAKVNIEKTSKREFREFFDNFMEQRQRTATNNGNNNNNNKKEKKNTSILVKGATQRKKSVRRGREKRRFWECTKEERNMRERVPDDHHNHTQHIQRRQKAAKRAAPNRHGEAPFLIGSALFNWQRRNE